MIDRRDEKKLEFHEKDKVIPVLVLSGESYSGKCSDPVQGYHRQRRYGDGGAGSALSRNRAPLSQWQNAPDLHGQHKQNKAQR